MPQVIIFSYLIYRLLRGLSRGRSDNKMTIVNEIPPKLDYASPRPEELPVELRGTTPWWIAWPVVIVAFLGLVVVLLAIAHNFLEAIGDYH